MRSSFAHGDVIRRVIERGDYIRRPAARLADHRGHKEWFHFCVSAPEVDAIVNFSLFDDLRSGSEEPIARLACAVRLDGWDGDIDHFEGLEVSARAGRIDLQFGESRVEYADGTYRVVARMRRRPIEVDLVFCPLTVPSQVNNIRIGDGPPLCWFLVPRLLAFGEIRVDGRHIEIRGAPGYHDHNWGYFRWGQDFAWVWGYGHDSSFGCPWAMAFDRLTDRARTTDLERGLLLWKGKDRHRLFRGRELQVLQQGFLHADQVLRLPRAIALIRPAAVVDIPAILRGRAESRGDVLEFEFSSHHVCQFISPNDDDLGTTVLSEVSGRLSLAGSVRGERVHLDGRAMFEFIGD